MRAGLDRCDAARARSEPTRTLLPTGTSDDFKPRPVFSPTPGTGARDRPVRVVVRHAECLAVLFGEPYGTLIMTLSVTCIEVLMIASLMLHGANNPTLARDAMFAVVMIVLNGLVGLALVLGALRYREQSYNLQGARAYLSVIMPLTVLTLVMPDLTVSTPSPALSDAPAVFVLVASLALYAV